jgi:hypothetical protein
MVKPSEPYKDWHSEQDLNDDLRGLTIERVVMKTEADEIEIWFTDKTCLVFGADKATGLGYARVGPDGP